MPHICRPFLKYKKDLREALAKGQAITFADPAIVESKSYTSKNFPIGTTIVVTNHPKRSWFARVERTETGWKVE